MRQQERIETHSPIAASNQTTRHNRKPRVEKIVRDMTRQRSNSERSLTLWTNAPVGEQLRRTVLGRDLLDVRHNFLRVF